MAPRQGDEDLASGEILRDLHRGAWRGDAPVPGLHQRDIIRTLSPLIEGGSVGLVWPRLRVSVGTDNAIGAVLEEAYNQQARHNARMLEEAVRLIGRLHDAGIAPVMVKGLAIAHRYPAGIVRTAGDIDLVIEDDDYMAAQDILADAHLEYHHDAEANRRLRQSAGPSSPDGPVVDLHSFSNWEEAASGDIFATSRLVRLGHATGGLDVHVPRDEDHLRTLCLHFLRHGAVRPLRLCDIALMLEQRHESFDWDRCLRGTRREREQVIVSLRLAVELLGAEWGRSSNRVPHDVVDHAMASWVVPAVLRQWARNPGSTRDPMLPEILENPRGIVRSFANRWPDPVTATIHTHAPFNDTPRLLVETTSYVRQLAQYFRIALPKQIEEMRR